MTGLIETIWNLQEKKLKNDATYRGMIAYQNANNHFHRIGMSDQEISTANYLNYFHKGEDEIEKMSNELFDD